MVFFFRCRFVAVSYFLKFGLLVLGYRIFPCFLLFRFGKFHYMVYRNLALYGLAYLYLTFGIVVVIASRDKHYYPHSKIIPSQ